MDLLMERGAAIGDIAGCTARTAWMQFTGSALQIAALTGEDVAAPFYYNFMTSEFTLTLPDGDG